MIADRNLAIAENNQAKYKINLIREEEQHAKKDFRELQNQVLQKQKAIARYIQESNLIYQEREQVQYFFKLRTQHDGSMPCIVQQATKKMAVHEKERLVAEEKFQKEYKRLGSLIQGEKDMLGRTWNGNPNSPMHNFCAVLQTLCRPVHRSGATT